MKTITTSTGIIFPRGTRIKISAGSTAEKILVVTKVVSPTVMNVRKYYFFDRWHDVVLQKWREMGEKFWTWYESRFEKTDEELD